ncbi:MAG: hypothetical protein ACMXYK_05675 [Candidatus Woesearchaeota archaeon]
MIHLTPYLVMSFIGVLLIILFSNIFVVIGGFVLIVYGTFEAIFHIMMDEHVRL